MKRYRCLSCGGEYTPHQPGGYYHVCPAYHLVPRGVGGPNIMPGDPDDYTDVTKIPQYEPILQPRNENIDDTIPDKPKMRAEGKGQVEVEE